MIRDLAAEASWRSGPAFDLAVLAVGKYGAQAMDYGSDLDLVFVYAPARHGGAAAEAGPAATRFAQRLLARLSDRGLGMRLYEIDTRLRPSGRQGLLVTSRAAFIRYHARALPVWEKLAMLRMRSVAEVTVGPRYAAPNPAHDGATSDAPVAAAAIPGALAEQAEQTVLDHLFRTGATDLPSIGAAVADLKRRIERELAREGRSHFNAKTGVGGALELELLVAAHQLHTGARVPAVRTRSITAALTALAAAGALPPALAKTLAANYRFLRLLLNRLRMSHAGGFSDPDRFSANSPKLPTLARRMGLPDAEDLILRYRACTAGCARPWSPRFGERPCPSPTTDELPMATAEASQPSNVGFPPKGSLKRYPFPRLLREIASSKLTGSLYLLSTQTKKVVFFEDGNPVFVRSNVLSECLGQILAHEGLITQEQCEQTLEAIRRTGKKQGELLVEMGILSEGNLRYGLQAQLRAKLFDIFSWDDGRYQFKRDTPDLQFGVKLDASAESVIIEAIQDQYPEERALAALDDAGNRYPHAATNDLPDSQTLRLLPEEHHFLRCLDGSRSVQQVIDAPPEPAVPSPAALLFGLSQSGLVSLDKARHGAGDCRGRQALFYRYGQARFARAETVKDSWHGVEVNGDDDIRAQRSRDRDRRRVHQRAVKQPAALVLNSMKDERNGARRAHGINDGPFAQPDLFARGKIRRDGGEGNGQVLNITVAIAKRLKGRGGVDKPAALNTEEKIFQRGEGFQLPGPLLEVVQHPEKMGAADEGAHGAAGNHVGFHVHGGQFLKHAYMGPAARRARGERKAQLFSGRFGVHHLFRVRSY